MPLRYLKVAVVLVAAASMGFAGGLVGGLRAAAADPAARAPAANVNLTQVGQTLFEQRCGQCHARAAGESTSFAPTLYRVVGRKAGSVEGFQYTPRILALDLTWDEQSLWTWLQSTTFDTPVIALRHPGAKSAAEADALVAYIATLK